MLLINCIRYMEGKINSMDVFCSWSVCCTLTKGNRELVKRSTSQCPCDESLPCAAKYQSIADHTACLAQGIKSVPVKLTASEKAAIVDEHNLLRGQVDPPATNMLKMQWDEEVAMMAEKWAWSCTLDSQGRLHHDKIRDIPGRYSIGQNIGAGYTNFSRVIQAWWAEKDNYKPLFGKPVNNVGGNKPIGHYTQMVWAATNRIGCALALCDGMTFHVCDYAPTGNFIPFKSPYRTGQQRCSECKTCDNGVCDCGDATCENGGKLNVTTCQCSCNYKYHVGPKCQVDCNYDKDEYFCGTQTSFYQKDCGTFYTASSCPKLCGVCPCADTSLTPDPSCGDHGSDQDSGSEGLRGQPSMLALSVLVFTISSLSQSDNLIGSLV